MAEINNPCKSGWSDGGCCCNCKFQLNLMCHPLNHKIGKGSISDQFGYACIVEYEDASNKGEALFYESKHGYCEYYTPR